MKKENIIKELIILIILAAPVVYMLFVWNSLPEQLPIHWNFAGEVDDYGPKYLFPLLNIGLYLLFIILPKIDPRKKNYTIFSSTYYKLRLILTVFFSMLLLLVIYSLLYSNIDFGKIFPAGFMFLIAILGNFMSTIRSNYFIGIRTPWTLNNEEVWRKTHYLAGKLWFYSGLLGGIIILFLDKQTAQYFAIALLILLLLVPSAYSYIYYTKETAKNEL
ncbi:MAG: DUF1648 domain-containing protein [Ignavibacteriae bacterium]|nr:MAG: DUF1648 domain-containing protein [Ignavibacteriota bacterium]